MKKIFLLCFIVITSICTASAGVTVFFTVSIENEYTGALESPLKYGLTTDDLKCQIVRENGYDFWQDYPEGYRWNQATEVVYSSLLYLEITMGEKVDFIVTIDKPGHKLHGSSTSFTTNLHADGNIFILENGLVFKIFE